MRVLEQVKKGDRPLQVLAIMILMGMVVLLAGLWYVQVVAGRRYVERLQSQSFRMVGIPAVRGKIVDRFGELLADNQPQFNVNLYLEDLRSSFRFEFTNKVRPEYLRMAGKRSLTTAESNALQEQARFNAASNIVWRVSSAVGTPLLLNRKAFTNHYEKKKALPLPVLENLSPQQVAIFLEKSADVPGVELDVEPRRYYPAGKATAHLLGYVRRAAVTERPDTELDFSWPLPDFEGTTGLEEIFNETLQGTAGVKSILVNNIGYRQREDLWSEPKPGRNIELTIDSKVQSSAIAAMAKWHPEQRGAAVVMDVRNGDILALVSAPAFDPNMFLYRVTEAQMAEFNDPILSRQMNRAVSGAYAPGSIFKIVVGLACLEQGLDPEEIYNSLGYWPIPGSKPVADLAGRGEFNFCKAFYKSSNPYFINYGSRIGEERIIEMGRRFGLGEPTGLPISETGGYFPKPGIGLKRDKSRWRDGDTFNLCIGQGEIAVTPTQVAVMTAAVANGGKVFYPRLVRAITQADGTPSGDGSALGGQIRNEIKVSARSLDILRDAMLKDVEVGTGSKASIKDFHVCGKTGTAQIKNPDRPVDHITWFASYAPFESPRYAVVVMVESGISGGGTSAPIARDIYLALIASEKRNPPTLASQEGVRPH